MKKTFNIVRAIADARYIVVDDGLYMIPICHDADKKSVRCLDGGGEEYDVADEDIIERGRFFKLVEFDPREDSKYEN